MNFCAACGGSLVSRLLKPGEPYRLVCLACGKVSYLDPKLAACAIIEDDSRVALVKRAIQPQRGLWVIPGGFVDRGEPVEEAVLREIREETGLEAELNGLLGLYSYPGETVVVAVYRAGRRSGELLALDESDDAAWFAEKDIPWERLAFSSTRDSLTDYFRSRKQ